jgi:hypothetical protein
MLSGYTVFLIEMSHILRIGHILLTYSAVVRFGISSLELLPLV